MGSCQNLSSVSGQNGAMAGPRVSGLQSDFGQPSYSDSFKLSCVEGGLSYAFVYHSHFEFIGGLTSPRIARARGAVREAQEP